MFIMSLTVVLMDETTIEKDVFGDIEIILGVLRIIQFEAKLEELKIESPDEISSDILVAFDEFYYEIAISWVET